MSPGSKAMKAPVSSAKAPGRHRCRPRSGRRGSGDVRALTRERQFHLVVASGGSPKSAHAPSSARGGRSRRCFRRPAPRVGSRQGMGRKSGPWSWMVSPGFSGPRRRSCSTWHPAQSRGLAVGCHGWQRCARGVEARRPVPRSAREHGPLRSMRTPRARPGLVAPVCGTSCRVGLEAGLRDREAELALVWPLWGSWQTAQVIPR